jgi:hypothetical protein
MGERIEEDETTYRMTPQFLRFLEVVGSVDRAMVAWEIARKALTPSTEEKRG